MDLQMAKDLWAVWFGGRDVPIPEVMDRTFSEDVVWKDVLQTVSEAHCLEYIHETISYRMKPDGNS